VNAAPFEKVSEQKCGIPAIKPDTSTDIIGGKDAIPYSWPWQIHLRKGRTPWCGASLITNQWLITAGHCATSSATSYKALLSVFNKHKNDEPGELLLDISEVHQHPKYDSRKLVNDIAVMKLKNPVNFTDHISPICLPAVQGEDLPAAGTNIFITGWGNTKAPSSNDSPTLKQEFVPLMSTEKCKAVNPSNPKFDETSHFCVGYENGGKGACHGDSGGPAMIQREDGSWKQIGVTSFAQNGICASKSGTGYTKLSSFIDFIKQYVPDFN